MTRRECHKHVWTDSKLCVHGMQRTEQYSVKTDCQISTQVLMATPKIAGNDSEFCATGRQKTEVFGTIREDCDQATPLEI